MSLMTTFCVYQFQCTIHAKIWGILAPQRGHVSSKKKEKIQCIILETFSQLFSKDIRWKELADYFCTAFIITNKYLILIWLWSPQKEYTRTCFLYCSTPWTIEILRYKIKYLSKLSGAKEGYIISIMYTFEAIIWLESLPLFLGAPFFRH